MNRKRFGLQENVFAHRHVIAPMIHGTKRALGSGGTMRNSEVACTHWLPRNFASEAIRFANKLDELPRCPGWSKNRFS